MITPESLFKRFEQITKQLALENLQSDGGDSVSVLLETDWVRVLLLKHNTDSRIVSIEVESYLPDFVEKGTDSDSVEKRDMVEVVNGMIAHLQYLLKLRTSGFNLEFIGPDYLWTATRDIDETLDLDFFEVIIPPIDTWSDSKI